MTRTTRQDWLALGLALLRDGGEGALTIERLCAALQRTKGAFYHHFADIAAYHAALLALWAERNTEQPIQQAGSGAAGRRRRRLHQSVRKVDHGLERAVHAWAVRSPAARLVVERVHARRIGFLAALRAGEPGARDQAELEYAAFIGALHVHPGQPRTQARILRNAGRR